MLRTRQRLAVVFFMFIEGDKHRMERALLFDMNVLTISVTNGQVFSISSGDSPLELWQYFTINRLQNENNFFT